MSLVCLFKSEFLNRSDSLTGVLLLITIQSMSLHHRWTALLLLFVFSRSLDRETQQNIYVTSCTWFMLTTTASVSAACWQNYTLHWLAARYYTGLLSKLTPKGVVFSFLFYIDLQLIPCPRVNMSCTNAAKGSEWHTKLQNQALCCLELVTLDPHAWWNRWNTAGNCAFAPYHPVTFSDTQITGVCPNAA